MTHLFHKAAQRFGSNAGRIRSFNLDEYVTVFGPGSIHARHDDVLTVFSTPDGRDIAGISNARGNVVGLMPHPEHAVEALTGPTTDGLGFFTSILKGLVEAS